MILVSAGEGQNFSPGLEKKSADRPRVVREKILALDQVAGLDAFLKLGVALLGKREYFAAFEAAPRLAVAEDDDGVLRVVHVGHTTISAGGGGGFSKKSNLHKSLLDKDLHPPGPRSS